MINYQTKQRERDMMPWMDGEEPPVQTYKMALWGIYVCNYFEIGSVV